MRRTLAAAAAVAAAVALAVLAPVALLADVSSCSVTASSYADSVVNPPKGEDTEFFVSTGGVPNIMFVLDTSGPMRRLPPDGAANSWGSFERPGNGTPGAGYGCTNDYGNTRIFNSPCGTTTLDLKPFNPSPGNPAPDFAEAKDASGRYCPHMVSGNQPPAFNKPGFDPDFYGGDDGSNPWFFQRDKVYHDAIYSPISTSDGWTDWAANPSGHPSIADFCAQWAADPAKKASCDTCMRDQGYFFDGTYVTAVAQSCGSSDDCKRRGQGTCIDKATGLEHSGADDGTAECRIPHVWLSGNFLNFFPPKFVVARKVMKDVLQSVRKIRLGLTVFSRIKDGSSFVSDGGTIVRELNPGCNMLGSPSQFDSNRGAFLSAVNGAFHSFGSNKYSFFGQAPIAETLLDVGNLYLTKDLTWFDANYEDADFEDATTSSNSKSVCFSCQASAILLISSGVATGDGKIPGTDFASAPMTTAQSNLTGAYAGMSGFNVADITSADCPVCNTASEAADASIAPGTCNGQQVSGACDDAGNAVPSYLPKVAWYLRNMDFRLDTETGRDGFPLERKQSITTYTIGLGARGAAADILAHAAEAGGGLYNGGSGSDVADARTLKDAILRVLEDVNTRSTSFGAASLSTLQVATTQGVLVPRFEPSRSAHWDGHLYAFDLYSEFASSNNPIPGKVVCAPRDPATSGPANGDYDCDGKCGSVFLMDADQDFIQEDGTGAFKKSLNRNRAACGGGNRCGPGDCSGPDPDDFAVPFWDAGSNLAPVKSVKDPVSGVLVESTNPDFVKGGPLEWNRRRIFTVVDANGDRKLRADDPLVDLRTADPATLVPYLNIQGTRFCNDLATRLTARGNPAGATIDAEVASGVYTACARAILEFVRGADIFDERRGDPDCASYPGSYCTRKYQLGDIFHSSPVEVWPPLASDSFSCSRGLHPQCLPSLFSASIDNPPETAGNANAYDDYAKSDRYKNRRKFALVGANDGMLHAFEIERKIGGSPNPEVGNEIWAFIPPDLLPKLKLLLEGVHHFYVDGTPMVRDVWIDGGIHNQLEGGGTGTADGVRQGEEFHTVAIVGERRGGTHYFALDVTDASDDLDARPRFMWLYPQPDDPESLQFGETYVEFVPKPPPIGPVRIDRGAPPCSGNYKEYAGGGGTRCFEERWIVFLSGGFDPQYTRGRGVHMVSVGEGEEVWDFSQPAGAASTCGSSSDPRCKLNYPVAATVGMMMWGTQPNFLTAASVDGYFDTATFGDTGGQLWTLRFNDPGILDATGKATNWFGARAFQNGATAATPDCGLEYCGGQPFFYITSNLPLAANGLYRTLAGTGDRYNLLDPAGGVCGPDNIRACMLKGCTVKLQDASGNPGAVFGVEPLLGTQSYGMDHPAYCSSVPTGSYTFDVTAPGGASCTSVTTKIDNLTITCPSAVTCSGQAESTRKKVAVSCSGGSCEPAAAPEHGIPIDLKGNQDKRNWFFSVQVFEQAGDRTIFRTLDEAKRYDAARLTEAGLKNVNPYDSSPVPGNLASPNDRGWSYYFDHGAPSAGATVTINGLDHGVYRTDERNASVSAVEYGCAFWNTMQPATPVGALDSVTSCPINSPCKAGKSQISYLYGANPGTGGLCLQVSGTNTRAQKSETLVPPHIGKLVAYVGQGQVSFGLTSVRVPQGGSNIQLGEAQDLASPVQWLPVDTNLHACRHAPKTSPPAANLCE